ncbi:MAG TPA: hypothetical protein VH914_09455 [Acidimicrobiia bacterium]|jgi:hypothetical protein|nr:hypothetical protein [Acidimicrobiia bacterium]
MVGRRITVGLVIVGLVGACAAQADASTSSQSVAGEATGSHFLTFTPENTHEEVGNYHSLGQLGNGSYDITTTEATVCSHGDASQSLTGTATLQRDDGAQLRGTVVGTQSCFADADGTSAVTFTLILTSGTRDLVGARVQFTGRFGNVVAIPDGDRGDETLTIAGSLSTTKRLGWWTLGQSGSVYAFGGAPYLGRATTPTAPATALAATRDGGGYWVVNSLGQVYAFGDARWSGNADRSGWSASERAVSIVSTASGAGYWLFTNAGRVVPFGDAPNLGEFFPLPLNRPIVAAIATPSHHGYLLVASDGGVFAYGDAQFRGSTGALKLNRPIVAAAAPCPWAIDGCQSPGGAGYWLIASDGGVFAFGGAPFRGSLGGRALTAPIVGASTYGSFSEGYVLTSSTGDAFDFSSNPFFGWSDTNALTSPPIAGITATG